MRCCVQNIPVSVFIIQLLHFHCCQESKCLVSDGISLWTVFISQTQEHEAHPNNIWCGPVKWKMKRLEERLRDENCRVQSVEFKLKFKGPLICRLWEEWQFGSGLVDKGVTASWRWTQSDQPEVVQWVKHCWQLLNWNKCLSGIHAEFKAVWSHRNSTAHVIRKSEWRFAVGFRGITSYEWQ